MYDIDPVVHELIEPGDIVCTGCGQINGRHLNGCPVLN